MFAERVLNDNMSVGTSGITVQHYDVRIVCSDSMLTHGKCKVRSDDTTLAASVLRYLQL